MKRALTLAVIAVAMVLIPTLASACPVCYGASGSPMVKGSNNAIMFLLGVVGFVQIGFVALFFTFWRRARALRRQRESFHLIDGGVPH
jgi:hypothetical protein